jgi:translocation and assembly module TamB
MIRRAFLVFTGLVAVLVAALGLLVLEGSGGRAEDQQSILASVISQALSSPDVTVKVGAVDGALSSKSTIRDVTLSDRNGVFLSIDQAELEWRRAALFSRRLEIERLAIGQIRYARKPVVSSAKAVAGEPLLPELPLKVIVKAFELREMAIAEPVFGHAARFEAKGRAMLGPPSEGLDTEIALTRLDRAGTIALRLLFVPKGESLDLAATLHEDAGGLVAHLVGIPGSPPVDFVLSGKGPLDHWQAGLDFTAGPGIGVKGSASLTREGKARNLMLDLNGRIAPLLPPLIAGLFPGDTRVSGRAVLGDDGAIQLDQAMLASGLAEIGVSGTIAADRRLDLALKLAAIPGKSGVARYQETTLEALTLSARATGPALSPDLEGQFTARALNQPGLAIASAEARFLVRQAGKEPGTIRADAAITGLKLATPEATRAAGGTITLAINGLLGAGFIADLRQAEIATPTARIGWTGRIGAGVFDGRITGTVPDLAAFEPKVTGGANLSGTLKGQGEAVALALEVSAPALAALDRPIRNLILTLAARDPFGKANGDIRASGSIDGKPLDAAARFSRAGPGLSQIRDLVFTLGANRLSGGLTSQPTGLDGRLDIDASDLGQLSALLLMPLSGSTSGTISLSSPEGRQAIAAKLHGGNLRADGLSIRTLDADLALADAFMKPRLSGTLAMSGLAHSGQRFDQAKLVATATDGGSDITLDARGPGTRIDAAAGIAYAEETRIDIRKFSAVRGPAKIALLAPATLRIQEGTTVFETMKLGVGGGTIQLSGQAGRALAIKIRASGLALASLRALSPDLALGGTLDAEADLSGSLAAPSGPYRLQIRRLEHPALRAAAMPRLDITVQGALAADRARVEADIKGGAKLALTIRGALPLKASGMLDLAIRGKADAALANASLAGGGQRISGQISVEGGIKGNFASPRIEGAATLAGGTFTDPLQGVKFSDIAGRFTGAGDSIRIEHLKATTPGGGTLAASGSILADPGRGMPADLRISGNNARLLANDVMVLVADLDLAVSGPLAETPSISGRVKIETLDVTIPDRLSSAAAPLPNARHIEPPTQTKNRLAMIEKQKKQRAQRRAASKGGARLALRLDAPSRITVRGRGVDAELGGSLDVSGTVHAPRAAGAFELRRGQLDLLTQRLAFARGRITFNGDIVPELDFLATTVAGGITAKVAVTGRADEPAFTLSSEPQLPPDEVLARLMFERAAGTLSPFQAVQLAQAVARLSGKGGPDFLDRTRKALGVDTLDVNVGKNGPSVGASRYITRNIRLGVKTGATPAESGVSVNVDVTRRIKLKGETTSDGRSSVGIGAEIEF